MQNGTLWHINKTPSLVEILTSKFCDLSQAPHFKFHTLPSHTTKVWCSHDCAPQWHKCVALSNLSFQPTDSDQSPKNDLSSATSHDLKWPPISKIPTDSFLACSQLSKNISLEKSQKIQFSGQVRPPWAEMAQKLKFNLVVVVERYKSVAQMRKSWN